MKYCYTSDYHLGHANIILYCGRPFIDIYDMDKTIIQNHNEIVAPDDYVFHNGDFCFRNTAGGKKGEGLINKPLEYIKQLNGHFIFIRGNHDRNNSLKATIERAIIYNKFIKNYINIVHNPKNARKEFPLNLVGHVHDKWKSKRLAKNSIMINVGVDVWNFRPIDINEILQEYHRFLREEK